MTLPPSGYEVVRQHSPNEDTHLILICHDITHHRHRTTSCHRGQYQPHRMGQSLNMVLPPRSSRQKHHPCMEHHRPHHVPHPQLLHRLPKLPRHSPHALKLSDPFFLSHPSLTERSLYPGSPVLRRRTEILGFHESHPADAFVPPIY